MTEIPKTYQENLLHSGHKLKLKKDLRFMIGLLLHPLRQLHSVNLINLSRKID